MTGSFRSVNVSSPSSLAVTGVGANLGIGSLVNHGRLSEATQPLRTGQMFKSNFDVRLAHPP